MAATITDGIDGAVKLEGQHLGYSDWTEITQRQVDLFAEATGDYQWIHVDVERAKAESPFGGTIAHGYLTLSLISRLLPTVVEMRGFTMGVNYGCDRIRFPAPVPVGSRVRLGALLDRVTVLRAGVQIQLTVTIDIAGSDKPACVAVVLIRRYV